MIFNKENIARENESKRLNTSVPSTNRRIKPLSFKPNIQKISYFTYHYVYREARKAKRLSSIQDEDKRTPRTMTKSNMTTRLKTYGNRLFKNLKNEERKQGKKIDTLKEKYVLFWIFFRLFLNYKESKISSIPSQNNYPAENLNIK